MSAQRTARGIWQRLRHPGLLRDTAHVGLWQAVRLGAQALWVLLIARLLGPQGYGTFAGIAGLGTTLGGLTGLGLGLLMLQDASREPGVFDARWRNGWQVSLLSGGVLCLLFVLGGSALFHAQLGLVALVAVGLSELLCFPMVGLAAFAYSARHRMGTAAALPALVALARLLAALLCWAWLGQPTLEHYVLFHLAATALCMALAWLAVQRQLKPRPVPGRLARRDLIEGGGFSLMWMVGNALTSLDKTLVLRLAGAQVAGLYGAAYRVATLLAMPIDAMTMAAGPRLFRHGGGQARQPGLIGRLFAVALGYGLLAAAALSVMACWLPWLLGAAFAPAVPAARWMAVLIPCYGLRLLGSNVLMASNRKSLRVGIECLGLGLLAVLAMCWVPAHGLSGSVAMICATEGGLAALTWLVVLWMQSRPTAGATATSQS